MKFTFYILATTIILSTGCQKSVSDSGGGGSTDSSFLPLTANSYWKYKDSAYSSDVTTETVLGKTTSINGMDYNKVLLQSGSSYDTAYFAKSGAQYFNYVHTSVSGSEVNLEILFLNDTASVGYDWSQNAGYVNSYPAKCLGQVVEKNITMNVEGKSYTNVIHTQVALQYNITGTYETFAYYNYFVAKGIGIIKISTVIDIFGTSLKTASNLFEYRIY